MPRNLMSGVRFAACRMAVCRMFADGSGCYREEAREIKATEEGKISGFRKSL